jgi:surface antigen
VRPRHALTLLALALPLPVIITGVPHPTSTAGAAREPLRDSLGTTPVITATPSPRPRATRPAPRRTASRSHRAAAHRHHVARPTPTTVRAHRSTHTTTTHTTAPRTSTSTSYPWAGDTSGGNDPWGFTKRQCVSYVAWRLDRAGRSVSTSRGWGSASGWDDVARRKGITVSSRPTVGSVAQWNAGERSTAYVSGSASGSFVAGSYGHVAWVTKVYSDGSVQVAQYNGDGSRSYSTMHVRAPRYLRL